jgi:hypothetical protein
VGKSKPKKNPEYYSGRNLDTKRNILAIYADLKVYILVK